jgi:hypothetical protein
MYIRAIRKPLKLTNSGLISIVKRIIHLDRQR